MQSERSWAFLRSAVRHLMQRPAAAGSDEMTKSRLTTIGFDADDTLWQNEQFYR